MPDENDESKRNVDLKLQVSADPVNKENLLVMSSLRINDKENQSVSQGIVKLFNGASSLVYDLLLGIGVATSGVRVPILISHQSKYRHGKSYDLVKSVARKDIKGKFVLCADFLNQTHEVDVQDVNPPLDSKVINQWVVQEFKRIMYFDSRYKDPSKVIQELRFLLRYGDHIQQDTKQEVEQQLRNLQVQNLGLAGAVAAFSNIIVPASVQLCPHLWRLKLKVILRYHPMRRVVLRAWGYLDHQQFRWEV